MKPRTIPLEDAFSFQEGPGVRKWQFTTSGIKLLNVGNILKTGELDLEKTDRCLSREEVEKHYKHFLVDEGDLVIASSGISFDDDGLLRTRGAFVHRSHLPLCLNTSTIRFKPKADSDLQFLRYWLDSYEFRYQITRLVTGSAQQNFGPSHLENLRITLPDPTEQRRIAGELERADGLRRTRRYALELADTFLPAAFLQMFGDPVRNTNGWPVFEMEELASVERGKFTPRPRNDPSYYGGKYPFIQTGDISNCGGRLNSWTQTLNEKGVSVSRCFPPGTIVIAIVGATIGVTAILGREMYCTDSVVGIQVDESKATKEYVEFLLRFWRPVFLAQTPETARANLNLETLRPLRIPSPPLPLQTRFAELVERHERLRSVQRESLRQAEHLFQSLLHRAFTT